MLIILALALSAAAIYNADVFTDPFATSVSRIEKCYFENGQISCEISYNRLGEMHGPQVHYDRGGRVIIEGLYEHGDWVMIRELQYENGTMLTRTPTWTPPFMRDATSPIPGGYTDYRRLERRPDPHAAEFVRKD
jgi:hypothetical protein